MPKYKVYGLILVFILFISIPANGQNFQLSGGADLRYRNEDIGKNEFMVEGLFLNLRKAFSDKKGDRLIAVGQIDFDSNFEKIKLYQTYLQYKGPLGKWNIRAGHYVLPFGLLSDYDTERLVLQTIEHLNLGIKLDTGIELLGFLGDFNYAISISQGVGRNRLTDIDSNKLVTGRVSWQVEDLTIGLSGLKGLIIRVADEYQFGKENENVAIFQIYYEFAKHI